MPAGSTPAQPCDAVVNGIPASDHAELVVVLSSVSLGLDSYRSTALAGLEGMEVPLSSAGKFEVELPFVVAQQSFHFQREGAGRAGGLPLFDRKRQAGYILPMRWLRRYAQR